MLDAVRRYLGVPDVAVDLYSPLPGRGGSRPVNKNGDDVLTLDDDGINAFTIGIMIAPEHVEGSHQWAITSRLIFFALRIEEVGPDYIVLGIRNSGHKIRVVHPRNDGAYDDAAANVVNYATDFFQKQATRGQIAIQHRVCLIRQSPIALGVIAPI
jgi:hypothetical protein